MSKIIYIGDNCINGSYNKNGELLTGYYSQHNETPDDWKNGEKRFLKDTVSYSYNSYNWRNNVKWIRYKVYKVDPLTRENITSHFGVDEPVVDVCYGASDNALKCRLPLHKLGINYQAGEMYRVEMSVEEYVDYNTPNSWLSKDGSDSPSLSNNRTMATGTDSVYIPEELEGKTIYCKVTAVNNFWLRNYDHVQVFYSHPVTIPINSKPLKAELNVSYTGNYLTPDNQATVSISDINGLGSNEKVTKVEYYVSKGATRVLTFDDLSVTSASSVKSVTYPKDFLNSTFKLSPDANIRIYAVIYTNKDRHAKTNTELVDYEVPAQDLDFSYSSSYFYGGIYHNTSEYAPERLSINVTPFNASIGFDLTEGASFTSSDPEVATFDAKGKLIPGDKTGSTTFTLTSPSGATRTLTYANHIKNVEVSGINAPAVGETFDLTADVPADAG